MRVYEAITTLAAQLDGLISRTVTADPSRVAGAPCVLVELPRWDGNQSLLCGDLAVQVVLVVIGQPGGLAEVRGLSDLLDETLKTLDTLDIAYSNVQPAAFVPFNQPLQAEPSMAYEITIERYL